MKPHGMTPLEMRFHPSSVLKQDLSHFDLLNWHKHVQNKRMHVIYNPEKSRMSIQVECPVAYMYNAVSKQG